MICHGFDVLNYNYDALLGSAPAARASRVAIVPYYLNSTVQIFSVPVIQRHRNAPPPLMGAGLAHGFCHHYKKSFFTGQKIL